MAAKKATKEKETPAPEKRRRLRKSQLRMTLIVTGKPKNE